MNRFSKSAYAAALALVFSAGGMQVAEAGRNVSMAPRAFSQFCASNPTQCSRQGAANQLIDMDAAKWSELRSVNSQVNRSIREVADRRGDVWRVLSSGGSGDCEDFALTKRAKLLAKGWPSSALLVSTARVPGGKGHAVLIVRTSSGNLVLDNRTSSIKSPASTGYRFYTMQSPSNPRRWIAVARSGPAGVKAPPKRPANVAGNTSKGSRPAARTLPRVEKRQAAVSTFNGSFASKPASRARTATQVRWASRPQFLMGR